MILNASYCNSCSHTLSSSLSSHSPDSLYGGLRSGARQEELVVPAELPDGLHHVEPLPGVQVTELSVTAVHQVAGQRLRVELHHVLLQLVPGQALVGVEGSHDGRKDSREIHRG